MAQLWNRGGSVIHQHIPPVRAPAEYIQHISRLPGAEAAYWPTVPYTWRGPHSFSQMSHCSLYCSSGRFYFKWSATIIMLTLEQAQVYYEHYSQLAGSGEWTDTIDEIYTLDKWSASPTQLFYDGVEIEVQAATAEKLYDVLDDPNNDTMYYKVLALSLALSELW